MQVLKVKASDILAFHTDAGTEHGEVGPGIQKTLESVSFEVYPIRETVGQGYYEYAEEPVWVDYRNIEQHFRVRNKYDFHHAWIALDFNPIVSEDHVYFERMHCSDEQNRITNPFATLEDLYMTDNDDESLRSADTYSTEESEDSVLSDFIDDSLEVHENDCDCVYCTATRESVKWFDRDWKPSDETESKVKSFIEYLERKYT